MYSKQINKQINNRIFYLDILNILACVAVLMLHHNGIVHNHDVTTLAWKQSLAFEVLFYWAVPVFFMLTGATLMRFLEKYSIREFFIKRLVKTFLPFLFFSLVLSIYFYSRGEYRPNSFQELLSDIFMTRVPEGWAYWFFLPLFSLYASLPVLSFLRNNKKILWYIVSGIFITQSCLPLIFQLFGVQYNWDIVFPFSGYVLFLLLGFLLSESSPSRKLRFLIYFLGVLGALFRYLGTYYYSILSGSLDRFLFGYMQFHSVLLAVAVFVFIKEITKITFNKNLVGFIRGLSSCSFGIYLIHVFVMYKIELPILNITPDNVYWRFVGAFLTYSLCLAIVFSVKKIPYVKSIFP